MTEWYTCAVSVDMKGMGTKAESQNLKDDRGESLQYGGAGCGFVGTLGS